VKVQAERCALTCSCKKNIDFFDNQSAAVAVAVAAAAAACVSAAAAAFLYPLRILRGVCCFDVLLSEQRDGV
jgi:hypothetical protein